MDLHNKVNVVIIVRGAGLVVCNFASSEQRNTSTNLDLEEFCVDVSTYEPVEWVEEEAETCETIFVKVGIGDYQ